MSTKDLELEQIRQNSLRSAERLYLCGYSMRRHIDTKVFQRMARWCRSGMCFELSVVAMMLLRTNETARYVYGVDRDIFDGVVEHAWVEFEYAGRDYICDLAWKNGIMDTIEYYREYPEREVRWVVSYEEFWELELPHELYRRMLGPESSYVLDYLALFSLASETDGFHEIVKTVSVRAPKYCGPRWMRPFRLGSKAFSAMVVADFAKESWREEPSFDTEMAMQRIWRKWLRYLKKQDPGKTEAEVWIGTLNKLKAY